MKEGNEGNKEKIDGKKTGRGKGRMRGRRMK